MEDSFIIDLVNPGLVLVGAEVAWGKAKLNRQSHG
jgi:hypothetical protein